MNTNNFGLFGLRKNVDRLPQLIKLSKISFLFFTSFHYELVKKFTIPLLLNFAAAIVVVLIHNVEQIFVATDIVLLALFY
jgi:hypothetical protein